MRYIPALEPDDLLRILNRGSTLGEERKEHAVTPLDPDLKPASEAVYEEANEEFHSELCSYVDRWLDTGRARQSGEEIPTKRKLALVPMAYRAFRNYAYANPPTLLLETEDADEDKDVPEDLCFVFAQWRAVPRLADDNPRKRALNEAARVLAALMASNWKYKIAKCRYPRCQMYFQLKTNRRVYTHGTFCSKKHNGSNTAAATTKKKRAYRKETLLSLAGKALNVWAANSQAFQRSYAQKPYLRDEVNKFIRQQKDPNLTRAPITLTWVTRNFGKIEKRAL
ncbi:MAG: hypothetical protein ACR2JB_18535 [Bryobacteraceae bacterium]